MSENVQTVSLREYAMSDSEIKMIYTSCDVRIKSNNVTCKIPDYTSQSKATRTWQPRMATEEFSALATTMHEQVQTCFSTMLN